jgi:hypothetical protein
MFNIFASTYTVKRKAAGSYVSGRWTEGAETSITIKGDLQTMAQEEMQELPEGRRINQTFKMYTETLLNTVIDENGTPKTNGDIVLIDGERFEVIAVYPYQKFLLNHYKITLQKVEQTE